MCIYALYLESDPRRQKAMAHVLGLLGCIAKGPTPEVALAATSDAITAYLRFAARHGEKAEAHPQVALRVVEHITVGQRLGSGDPALLFGPDRAPLSEADAVQYLQRLEWSRAELVALLRPLSTQELAAQPARGRSIRAMMEHLVEMEHFYVCALGRVAGLPAPGCIVQQREGPLLAWMAHVRERELARLRALSPAERERPVVRWGQTWTARKVLRRMLEHEWEHLVELADRLGQPL
jgi:predicted RNase H-like HicB family nuclease/uncharacterized damage-inducible protein DinB